MNKYQIYEQKGRNITSKAFENLYNIESINDEYSPLDLIITRKETMSKTLLRKYNKIAVEVKYREGLSSTSYPDFILEVQKYKSMLNEMSNYGCTTLFYINIFPGDSKIVCWELHRMSLKNFKKSKIMMNKSTCRSTTEKVEKECYMLTLEDPCVRIVDYSIRPKKKDSDL